jgi:UDP-N-acetylmuramoyl-tripeptide--D-alanyl-D-alanine ligase
VTAAVSAVVLSAGMVAQATEGRLVRGRTDHLFESVSIDSRTIASGALFVALAGDRFDGHAFVGAAIDRGSAGLVVAAHAEDETVAKVNVHTSRQPAVIVVDDTLRALQGLAREVRRRSGTKVVAITGSAGKTTTKEATAALLSARYRVFRNRGNLNNHIGLPLSLLELRDGPDMAVVELGMNHAGEIRLLVGLAEPEIRVWTNVGDAHIGQFTTQAQIADAKAEIFEAATPTTLIVVNADDPLVMLHARRFTGRRLTFGETAGADVRASHVADRGFDGTEATVETPAGPLHLRVPLPGRVQLSNVLAAVTVAVECGVPVAEIGSRVAALVPVARRGAIATLGNGARVIDDSYNASPTAVRAMLAALAATPTSGRRLAVLGEMLELGGQTRMLHEACGRAAVASGVDELVVVGGPGADGLADAALAAGMGSTHVHRFATSGEAARVVPALIRSGDLVLIKGSRGTRTDLIVDRLTEVA